MSKTLDFHYGMTVTNQVIAVALIEPLPPTFAEWVHMIFMEVWEIFFPSFLLACSITAFHFALGGF